MGERERALQGHPHLGKCALCGNVNIVATCAQCGRVVCGLCQGVDPQRPEVMLCATCVQLKSEAPARASARPAKPEPPAVVSAPAPADEREIVIPPGCEVLITIREPERAGKETASVAVRRSKARPARAPRKRTLGGSAANSPLWLVLPLAFAAGLICLYLSLRPARNEPQATADAVEAPAATIASVAWTIEKQGLLARLASEQAWNARLWADNASLRARNLELESQGIVAPATEENAPETGWFQQTMPYLEWVPPILTVGLIAALVVYMFASGGVYTWLCAWLPAFLNRRDFRHFGAAIWRADGRHLAWSAWTGARLPSGRRMNWATWQAYTRTLVRAGVARRVEERSDWAVEAVVERKEALPPLVKWM